MAKKVMQPYSPGIQIPLDEAKVKTGAEAKKKKPNQIGIYCHKGSICARGTAVPPGTGITLVRLHARVYRFSETVPPPTEPPSPALGDAYCDPWARVIEAHGNLNWQFDAIPNAQCEDAEPGNADNRLAVWAVWDQGGPTRDIKEFRGICSTVTDCEKTKSSREK